MTNEDHFKTLDTAVAQATVSPICPRWLAVAAAALVAVLKSHQAALDAGKGGRDNG